MLDENIYFKFELTASYGQDCFKHLRISFYKVIYTMNNLKLKIIRSKKKYTYNTLKKQRIC